MSHHEKTTRESTKEADAMYEPSNEERELERLFAAESAPLTAPPPGLAEKIKAEIPEDLGWRTSGDGAAGRSEGGPSDDHPPQDGSGGVVVPFARHRGVLALAATLVLATGLFFLLPRGERGLDPAVDEDIAATAPQAERSREAVPSQTPSQTPSEAPPERRHAPALAEARAERDASDDDEAPLQFADQEPASAGPRRAEPEAEAGPEAGDEAVAESERLVENERVAARADDADATAARERRALEREIDVSAQAPVPVPRTTTASSAATPIETDPVEGEPPPPPSKVSPRPSPRAVPSPPPPPPPPPPAPPASLGERHMKLEETAVLDGDEAYDAMYFESAGVNPFIDTEDDALSTFGLDVDTASYTVVRRYLRDGVLPPEDAVRVEEMLNFFDYGDPPPAARQASEPGEPAPEFSLAADVAPSRWAPGANRTERYYLVRFGLEARDVLATERPPSLLTFVVDVSGSMAGGGRLGLVQRALGLLLDNLRDDDQVALVVYGSQGRVLLPPTSDRARVQAAIAQLRPEGSTNAAEGLRLAYELTARNKQPGRIHRVILCSDGVANVGTTTRAEGILAEVKQWADQGIELTTVGFGMGNYNDTLMETLADRGNGRYAYIDTLEEARRLFVDDLTGTLTTVAAEARAQVEFDPDVVSRYRLLGYENRDIADERFRDDTVDAGEIGAGHTVTALYEVKTKRPLRQRDRLATLTLRYASIARGEMVEQSLDVTGRDASPTFEEAPPALRLAATVAEFAEVLRGSYWARDVDLHEVFAEAQTLAADWPADAKGAADVAELAALVGKAAELQEEE